MTRPGWSEHIISLYFYLCIYILKTFNYPSDLIAYTYYIDLDISFAFRPYCLYILYKSRHLILLPTLLLTHITPT